jgi:hypothetical protein
VYRYFASKHDIDCAVASRGLADLFAPGERYGIVRGLVGVIVHLIPYADRSVFLKSGAAAALPIGGTQAAGTVCAPQ